MAHNFVTKERALIVIISEEFLPKHIRPLASDEAKSRRRQILNRSIIACNTGQGVLATENGKLLASFLIQIV